MAKGQEVLDRLKANGVDSSELSRISSVMRNLHTLAVDWMKIYNEERTRAVDRIGELEEELELLKQERDRRS